MSDRSWMGDKRVDEVFTALEQASSFVGLRYVKIVHMVPGERAIVDVMMPSGERMYASIFHGRPVDESCSDVLREMGSHRRDGKANSDAELKDFIPDLLVSMSKDGNVDLGMTPGKAWLKGLLKKKLLNFMKSGGPERHDFDAAMEAVTYHYRKQDEPSR